MESSGDGVHHDIRGCSRCRCSDCGPVGRKHFRTWTKLPTKRVVQRCGGEWVLQQGSGICGLGLLGFLVCGHHRPHLSTPCLQALNHVTHGNASVSLCWHPTELQILSTVACTDVKFVGGLLFHISNVFFSFLFLQCIGG